MVKNKLSDLNNHLFAQLERLDDEEMSAEEFEREIERSKSIALVAGKIIENGRLILDAQKTIADYNGKRKVDLELLDG